MIVRPAVVPQFIPMLKPGDQRAAHMQKKNHADQCYDQAFLREGALEGIDGAIDQGRRTNFCSR